MSLVDQTPRGCRAGGRLGTPWGGACSLVARSKWRTGPQKPVMSYKSLPFIHSVKVHERSRPLGVTTWAGAAAQVPGAAQSSCGARYAHDIRNATDLAVMMRRRCGV